MPTNNGVSANSYYSDATCQTLLANRSKASTPAPSTASSIDTTNDVTAFRIFQIGARYAGPVYFGSGASCYVSSSDNDFFALGAEIPGSAFVSAALKTAQ